MLAIEEISNGADSLLRIRFSLRVARAARRSSTRRCEYELKVLSFSAGDTRKPEFIALNPRHQVPVLVDGDFVLYESNAIVEYLDEAYPGRGAPLFPGDVKDARDRAAPGARGRQLCLEIDRLAARSGVLEKA